MSEKPFAHLYVHIPFCKHKCGYCDFNAYAGMDRLMPNYITALERELAAARELHEFAPLQTVYLGGGTPSLLPPELIERLLKFIRGSFDIAPDAEVTLEANPASTDEARVAAWLDGGVNRLSLGVQGFEPLDSLREIRHGGRSLGEVNRIERLQRGVQSRHDVAARLDQQGYPRPIVCGRFPPSL